MIAMNYLGEFGYLVASTLGLAMLLIVGTINNGMRDLIGGRSYD